MANRRRAKTTNGKVAATTAAAASATEAEDLTGSVNGPIDADRDVRAWLLMLYMVADAPNLEGPLALDLEELRRALAGAGDDAPQNVHVVAQIEYPSGVYKRYCFTPEKAVFLAGGVSPGRFATLAEFVKWTVGKFCAHRSALVFWGHAAGVAESLEVPIAVLSQGPPGGHHLLTRDAGAAVDDGILCDIDVADVVLAMSGPKGSAGSASRSIALAIKGIDKPLHIVGFDACFMSMIEIATEIASKVRFVLAPQTSIGLEGWHYDLLLDHILHNPDVRKGPVHDDARRLGLAAVAQVGLREASPTDLALLDLAPLRPDHAKKLSPIEVKAKALFDALINALTGHLSEMNLRHEVMACFNGALWAGARQFLDLADVCRQLTSRVPVPAVRKAAAELLGCLVQGEGNLVVDQLTVLGLPLGGVSIYCPWVRATSREAAEGVRNVEIDMGAYLRMRFPRVTGYANLFLALNNIVAAERRWIRREAADAAGYAMAEMHRAGYGSGREPDTKPSSREPDPKPAGREPDPKGSRKGEGGRPQL